MHTDTSTQRIDSLQGLRAIAFVAIFISHSNFGGVTTGFGAWGVSVFCVLSGFVMAFSYLSGGKVPGNSIRFALKKMGKLYPLHIAMMLLCVIWEFFHYATPFKLLLTETLLHTLMIQTWIPIPTWYSTLNGQSWYLAVCFLSYLVFPRVLSLTRKRERKPSDIYRYFLLLFCIQIAIAVIAQLFGAQDKTAFLPVQWITYYLPVSRLVDFLLGYFLGYLYLTKKPQKFRLLWLWELVVVLGIAFSFAAYAYQFGILGAESVKYVLLWTPTTVALLWVLVSGGFLQRMFSGKLLIGLGSVSAEAFLIHGVSLKYTRAVLNRLCGHEVANSYVIAPIALAITLLASFLWQRILIFLRTKKLK